MKNHKLFYGSSYDRSLDILLDMWPDIKKRYPDATLDICYGWELYDLGFANNPERMQWKEKINAKMKQPGITHHEEWARKNLKRLDNRVEFGRIPHILPRLTVSLH